MVLPVTTSVDQKMHSVTEITREIKRVITTSFGAIWIEGELSGYKRHTSGHHYFTLKDANACIACTCWRGNASRLTFQPADGMKVQAWGNLDVYEVQGKYQFIVNTMRPAGIGELQRAFDLLKQKLQGVGLFARRAQAAAAAISGADRNRNVGHRRRDPGHENRGGKTLAGNTIDTLSGQRAGRRLGSRNCRGD